MKSRRFQVVAVLVVALGVGGAVFADDEAAVAEAEAAAAVPDTLFETTVDYSNMKKAALEGQAGDVQVTSVEFVASNVKSGGISGVFSSSDTEVVVALTTSIACFTASEKKWKLDFLVEFLDEDGEVIDRATSNGSLKKNDKVFNIKHTTLRWALSHIKKARISVAAKQ